MNIIVKSDSCLVVYDDKKRMLFDYDIIRKDCFFRFDSNNLDKYFAYEAINIFTNFIVKKYRVYTLNVLRKDILSFYKCFYNNLYFENKDFMCRKIEAYRYLIDDKAFDSEGFIINQGILSIIPFKSFKSDKKGCGWISVYNLFKLIHKEKTIREVARDVSKYALFRGLIGQDIFSIYYYLRKQNVDAYLTPLFKRKCIKDIKNSKCGIILYIHKSGSHYVAYNNLGNGKCIIYNAVYGRSNHIMDIEEFYKRYSITPFGMVIWVNEV